jgi:hypothetical protein
MAYPAGYIELNNERDVPLIKEVLHARFITHAQLFGLMQFAGVEACREAFNWRVKRLVDHGLLLRHDVPSFGRNFVYSLGPSGVMHMTSLGVSCVGMTTGFVPVRDASRVAHSVDVTDIRLHLLRAGVLKEWRSEVDVRASNDLTNYRFAKDYDSIMTLAVRGREVKVALEYERQPKAKKRYKGIQETIENEQRVDRFLYLFPEYKLLWFVHALFRKTARRMYFGLTYELARDLLATRVVDPQMRFATLEVALQ